MPISNPNIPQGILNRLKASILWDNFPGLNVTPPYLGKAGISLTFDSKFTTDIPTMTGLIKSGEPYVMCSLAINLLRTQALAAAYKAQAESNTVFGNCTVRPDVTAGGITPYPLLNVSWGDMRELTMAGVDPSFLVLMTGYYNINNQLWNS